MTTAFEPEPGETALLEQACLCADELERIRRELRTAPLTVLGSEGQPRPHPLLDQARHHRATMAALLKALRPDPAEARRLHAQHAAKARWGRHSAPQLVS